MDPLTAGFQFAAAFFNFLSTPAGQKMCDRLQATMDGLAQAAHDHITAAQKQLAASQMKGSTP